jgi:molybdopterin synthase catalytic subunit
MRERDGVFAVVQGDPIELSPVRAWVSDPAAGAVVLFEGTTRAGPGDGAVERLEYEAYVEMAEQVLVELGAAARARWGLCKVALLHRTGAVAVSEVSVLVALSAPHRAEAYAASAWLMDRLKAEAPVWKREHTSGAARWVANTPPRAPVEQT